MKSFARFVLGRRSRAACPPATGTVTTVVFDFDGTLADTFYVGLEILNQLAGEFGFRSLKEDELDQAREMTTRQLMRFLGIPSRKLPSIGRKGVQRLRARIHEIQPIAGIPPVIRELHRRGFKLGIITSNSEENVSIFLKNHAMDCFDFVRSSSRLMGKARVIRGAMKTYGFTRDDVLFVGDETRDIEACRTAGIRCAAVAWGYNSRSALEAQLPHCMLDKTGQLLEILPEPAGPVGQ